ncbi:hypothetical protein CHS0354_022896 [Potamilus streckersoni]|uniref:Uncharacterized protein n=1 Tax=Potamilus streckersoni TaxID=2493646 RepID=A0AAE0S267_9BIVA|nr:hypothetical protein CHS0354_022896 [Potamilus streckersoni]
MRSLFYLLAVISVAMSITTPPPEAGADLEGGGVSLAQLLNTVRQTGGGMMGRRPSIMGGLGSLLDGGGNLLRSIFVLTSENEKLHQLAGIDCLNNPWTVTGQIDPFCVMLHLSHPIIKF